MCVYSVCTYIFKSSLKAKVTEGHERKNVPEAPKIIS